MSLIIKGIPIPKPRMTQQDKWKQRPCVMKYRAWADQLRWECKGKIDLTQPSYLVAMIFYLPDKGGNRKGVRHVQKPDIDNLEKGVLDALFPNDASVYKTSCEKYYDDGNGCRLELDIS